MEIGRGAAEMAHSMRLLSQSIQTFGGAAASLGGAMRRPAATPEEKAYRAKRRQQNQRAKAQRKTNRKRG